MGSPNSYIRYWELKVRKEKWPVDDYLSFYVHGNFNLVLTALQYIGIKDIYTDFLIKEISEEYYLLHKDEANTYEDEDKNTRHLL